MFGNADTATPTRIVDKGDAKALLIAAGTLAKPVDGNAESLRPTVDRTLIDNRLERGIFDIGSHSKNHNIQPNNRTKTLAACMYSGNFTAEICPDSSHI